MSTAGNAAICRHHQPNACPDRVGREYRREATPPGQPSRSPRVLPRDERTLAIPRSPAFARQPHRPLPSRAVAFPASRADPRSALTTSFTMSSSPGDPQPLQARHAPRNDCRSRSAILFRQCNNLRQKCQFNIGGKVSSALMHRTRRVPRVALRAAIAVTWGRIPRATPQSGP
jgi:hypothetical protein